jgi:hypothetical protein
MPDITEQIELECSVAKKSKSMMKLMMDGMRAQQEEGKDTSEIEHNGLRLLQAEEGKDSESYY